MSKEETKKRVVSEVLGRELSDTEMQFILEDWKAFYDNPTKYSGTVVVQLVNEYLDGFNSTDTYKNISSGAQSVMEKEINLSRLVVNMIRKPSWLNERGRKVIDDFNYQANTVGGKLILSLYEEPTTEEDLESLLEEGMYDYIFPNSNTVSEELKDLIQDSENYGRFLSFSVEDLLI